MQYSLYNIAVRGTAKLYKSLYWKLRTSFCYKMPYSCFLAIECPEQVKNLQLTYDIRVIFVRPMLFIPNRTAKLVGLLISKLQALDSV